MLRTGSRNPGSCTIMLKTLFKRFTFTYQIKLKESVFQVFHDKQRIYILSFHLHHTSFDFELKLIKSNKLVLIQI